VVVLQGDEGPFLRGDDRAADRSVQMRIRTGVLHAVYTPDGAREFERARTPINTFRIILARYFEADLPLLDDRVYSWPGMLRPVEPDCRGLHVFTDITDQVLDPGSN
jgi:hypothetical protein